MKRVFAILAVLAFTALVAVSYAQSLSDWESGVFQDVVERWHEMLYSHGGDWVPGTDDFAQIYSEVAGKYNTTVDEVKNIDNKALDQMPSDADFNIFDDLSAGLKALPQTSYRQDSERVHAEVANRHGVSLYKLHEIEYLIREGMPI